MEADEATREILDLRHDWLAANPPRNARLLLHLPPRYADAIWTDFRERLSPEERARAESQDGHPVDGGTLYGMTIGVDVLAAAPRISEMKRVVVQRDIARPQLRP